MRLIAASIKSIRSKQKEKEADEIHILVDSGQPCDMFVPWEPIAVKKMRGDYQRHFVYEWEREVMPRYDRSTISFPHIEAVVAHIWREEGLAHPPLVESLPPNCVRIDGQGCRQFVRFFADSPTPTWLVLHELTHACMRSNVGHGPLFVGYYMKLLDRYCRIPLAVLMHTANRANIEFDLRSMPFFVDPK